MLGRAGCQSPDRMQIHDPQGSKKTNESCHGLTQRPRLNNADNQTLELSSLYYRLSEKLEQFTLTMEGEVRACTKATMEEVADRKQMEERLQVRWQSNLSEEADARTAAVCRLDSEMTMLSANINELREGLQSLMDLMYGELRSLSQSVQVGAASAPQSRQGVQQRGSQCSPSLAYAGASTAAASVSPTPPTYVQDTPSSGNITPPPQLNLGVPGSGSKEQTAFQDSTLVSQEQGASFNGALVTQEDVSSGLSRPNSSTEHQLRYASDILARAAESAAALHEEQLVGMHDKCRYVLEKLLEETVQGCLKYSIVKAAIVQALDALGTKETEAWWRDTCWTLHKIEDWLAAKDRVAPGKVELSAKKILDAAQANKAAAILLGSAGTAAAAHGSHVGSFPVASTTSSHGA